MATDKAAIGSAAETSDTLSELLQHLGRPNDLGSLTGQHIEKFRNAINETESAHVATLASTWRYPGIEAQTDGFPVLDGLWDAGTDSRNGPRPGQELIARLAEFQPDWIGRWWQWRCANKTGLASNFTAVGEAVLDALTREELMKYLPLLERNAAAAIVLTKPEFLDCLSSERRGIVLRSAFEPEAQFPDVLQSLSKYDIPSNATAVIDRIFDWASPYNKVEKDEKISKALAEITNAWKSHRGSDPISRAITAGHARLEAFLRSPWNQVVGIRTDDKTLWSNPILWERRRVFGVAASAAPDRFKLEVGFLVGVSIAEDGGEPSKAQITEELETLYIETEDSIIQVFTPMVELWSALRKVAKYESSYGHMTEIVGPRERVSSLAEHSPGLWAESLPWILARSGKFGQLAEIVTLALARTNSQVRVALDHARHADTEQVRDLAHGLWTLLNGVEDPGAQVARSLADTAARYVDDVPVFPHPLSPMSATWLGSLGVEQAITNGVRRAATRFANVVRNQGGKVEEALAESLVKEIEVEFRNIELRVKALGSNHGRFQGPLLSVRQRPTSRSSEEPVYGCDLAWLLHATIRGFYLSTWADLVQVKKSKALLPKKNVKARANNAWTIEVKQLKDILKWSGTAVYWLIASEGEVLVVPAKHLLGLARGRNKRPVGASFMVGYNDVRSASIPLEQYLVDLLIGQWVGTTSEEVVKFVEGNLNIRPMSVVEVNISVDREAQ